VKPHRGRFRSRATARRRWPCCALESSRRARHPCLRHELFPCLRRWLIFHWLVFHSLIWQTNAILARRHESFGLPKTRPVPIRNHGPTTPRRCFRSVLHRRTCRHGSRRRTIRRRGSRHRRSRHHRGSPHRHRRHGNLLLRRHLQRDRRVGQERGWVRKRE